MSISIGFVLFNPGIDFVDRVELLKLAGYRIFIFDNSPEHTRNNTKLHTFYDVNYYTCGRNLGLGVGITSVCYNAYVEKFDWLLFFDQDTKFTDETLEHVYSCVEKKRNELISYSAVQFSNKLEKSDASCKDIIIERKRLLISSGSLFNLRILKKINWHNTNYFVDGVDYEFCLRSHSKGYLLGEISSTPGFDHVTGQADKRYSFINKELYLRKYSAIRIKDVVISYTRLFFRSLFNLEFKYSFIFLKSLTLFFIFQLLQRVLDSFGFEVNHK